MAKYWFSSIWNPFPWPPRLIIGEDVYVFRKLKSDRKFSPFKKDTWNQWKFSLQPLRFNVVNEDWPAGSTPSDSVVFHFRTRPGIFTTARTYFYPVTGRIEADTDIDLLIFAGLYLVEDFVVKWRENSP